MNLKCENCKKTFSIGITSKGGSMTFMGGINAQCPFCGHMNVIPGGKFEFDKTCNVIKAFILDNDIPENDLLKFLDVAKDFIAKKDIDKAAFENQITSINPKFKSLLQLISIKTSADFFGLLALLVTLLGIILQNKESSPPANNITINNVIYQDSNRVSNQKPLMQYKPKRKKSVLPIAGLTCIS